MRMRNFRRLALVLTIVTALQTEVSHASPPLMPPAATVHVCVLFKSGTLEADNASVKAARNFGSLVSDHLRGGSSSLSLEIWQGVIDRPDTKRRSQNYPTSEERAYVEFDRDFVP
jgi:hypothetical protein